MIIYIVGGILVLAVIYGLGYVAGFAAGYAAGVQYEQQFTRSWQRTAELCQMRADQLADIINTAVGRKVV